MHLVIYKKYLWGQECKNEKLIIKIVIYSCIMLLISLLTILCTLVTNDEVRLYPAIQKKTLNMAIKINGKVCYRTTVWHIPFS